MPETELPILLESADALAAQLPLADQVRLLLEIAVRSTSADQGGVEITPEGRSAAALTAVWHAPSSDGSDPDEPGAMSVPLYARGEAYGLLRLRRYDGQFTQGERDLAAFVATQMAVAVAQERLALSARRREHWFEALYHVAQAILSGQDEQQVLELIARSAMPLVHASMAIVVTPDDSGDVLVVRVAVGPQSELTLGLRFPFDSVSGDVIRSRRSQLVQDTADEARIYRPDGELPPTLWGPTIYVPMISGDRAVGSLNIGNPRGAEPFEDSDIRLLEAFAAHAAVAIEYARAQADLARYALLEERERISRELHDGVIQSLFAVGFSLRGLADRTPDGAARTTIAGAVDDLGRVMEDIRNYIRGLRPGILAGRHLEEALVKLSSEFQDSSGVVAAVEIDRRLAARLEARAADIVQITREALSNVARHAHATTCRVSLRSLNGGAVLEIDDDGRGPDGSEPEGGNGLLNIRERATSFGGSVEIGGVVGEGFTVKVFVPLRRTRESMAR